VAGINILKNFIPRINHIPIGELIAKMWEEIYKPSWENGHL
jgi:hypothetical protein